MKKVLPLVSLFIAISLLGSGCKKDEAKPAQPVEETGAITAGTVNGQTWNGNGSTTTQGTTTARTRYELVGRRLTITSENKDNPAQVLRITIPSAYFVMEGKYFLNPTLAAEPQAVLLQGGTNLTPVSGNVVISGYDATKRTMNVRLQTTGGGLTSDVILNNVSGTENIPLGSPGSVSGTVRGTSWTSTGIFTDSTGLLQPAVYYVTQLFGTVPVFSFKATNSADKAESVGVTFYNWAGPVNGTYTSPQIMVMFRKGISAWGPQNPTVTISNYNATTNRFDARLIGSMPSGPIDLQFTNVPMF